MKCKQFVLISFLCTFSFFSALCQSAKNTVPDNRMQQVYQEIKTPFKYGLILVPAHDSLKMDCRSVFKKGNDWFMTYVVYDGRGYETWLAKSQDLLQWNIMGKIMSFSQTGEWDENQKAGSFALQDYEWGGSYSLNRFKNKYWMSYYGGNSRGYEAGILSIGMAYTTKDPSELHEWQRLERPVLKPTDPDARWWENGTMYKNLVIQDKAKKTGYSFLMYYNAKGDSLHPEKGSERIGMAVSNDMTNWKRYPREPVLNHHKGITGNGYIQKMNDLYVMFYFGAFWPGTKGAFNRFACSYDLINWTDWKGANLIEPSEPYDDEFAHKSVVMKYKGTVYHFYCAVNKKSQRGIALATSVDIGKSKLQFIY